MAIVEDIYGQKRYATPGGLKKTAEKMTQKGSSSYKPCQRKPSKSGRRGKE